MLIRRNCQRQAVLVISLQPIKVTLFWQSDALAKRRVGLTLVWQSNPTFFMRLEQWKKLFKLKVIIEDNNIPKYKFLCMQK